MFKLSRFIHPNPKWFNRVIGRRTLLEERMAVWIHTMLPMQDIFGKLNDRSRKWRHQKVWSGNRKYFQMKLVKLSKLSHSKFFYNFVKSKNHKYDCKIKFQWARTKYPKCEYSDCKNWAPDEQTVSSESYSSSKWNVAQCSDIQTTNWYFTWSMEQCL